MTTRRYQKTLDRQQEMLLPPCVDDYVSENKSVRTINAYVNMLDLEKLDFKNAQFIRKLPTKNSKPVKRERQRHAACKTHHSADYAKS